MRAEELMNMLTIVTLFEMTVAMELELKFSEMVEVAKDWRLVLCVDDAFSRAGEAGMARGDG